MVLEDYKEIVATCATIATMGHMLSGTLVCRDIHRKGTSKGFDPMPFIGGVGMCTLMLRHAWMLGDPAMVNVNVFGLLMNMLYMTVFYYYSPETSNLLAMVGKVTAFVAAILAYAELEDPEKIVYRMGMIVTVLLLMLMSAPLAHLGQIIKTKNTDILPFPLTLMGTVVTAHWLLYGIIVDNVFIIFQNAVGVVLCMVQLSLFAIYPSKKQDAKEKVKKK
ncbi:hypothetical protein KM043_017358 [Ampulex compressa]|nr:hypothetical protein KM043_017358 [Ampulex compressa]